MRAGSGYCSDVEWKHPGQTDQCDFLGSHRPAGSFSKQQEWRKSIRGLLLRQELFLVWSVVLCFEVGRSGHAMIVFSWLWSLLLLPTEDLCPFLAYEQVTLGLAESGNSCPLQGGTLEWHWDSEGQTTAAKLCSGSWGGLHPRQREEGRTGDKINLVVWS